MKVKPDKLTTPQKNKIVGIDPGKLKAGDIVLRTQSSYEGDIPVAKFLILGHAKAFPKWDNTYFECYLLWCDENYLGYHNKVGDKWQIPWYAFQNEPTYKMEFQCDKSRSAAK